MKKLHILMLCAGIIGFNFGAYADDSSLNIAIQNAKSACSGISDKMSGMKTMAGINTAVTGVGTVTGAVALGTGIAKAGVDAEQRALITKWIADNEDTPVEELTVENWENFENEVKNLAMSLTENGNDDLKKIAELEEKSKTLGKVRTGTLAASTVADTAGVIIAANNKVDEDLQGLVDKCIESIDVLKEEQLRARTENTASESDLAYADKILNDCADWKNVDLSSIDKRATGAAVSAGVGAALGLAGTITSASANSDSVRSGDTSTEAKLNTASNILAGGTTVASGVATVFNATQISAIKKAVAAADKCEEALR